MKKLFKWLLGIMAFVVILLVLAVILLPIVFDPNEHKPQIQQVMTDSIGREVALNGPIEWSVFPWVAINIKDVTIANEAGFKGDYLAQVKQVAVRVKLLPLLSQQIKIGQVELQQPQIKLQVAKSGNNNWQSLLNHLESNEGDNQANESPTDFEIRGIVISDGDLNYKDAQADLEIQLADMSFQSDVIKANTATAMSLQAQIELPALAMNGQLDMAWDATHLASEHLPIFNFKRMSFDGQSDGIAMALTTQGNTVMDLNQDTLNIDLLEFSYGVMQLTTPVVGQQISKNMSLSGLMEVSAFSVDELLQAMGSPLENAANNELSGSNRWSLANNRLFLSQIDFKLDDSEIKGQVDIKDLSQLRG
ncbi:MAG: AsmA family protein, partial [Marinicella sp.]